MPFVKCRVLSKRLKSGGRTTSHKFVKRRRDLPGQAHKIRVMSTQRTKFVRTRGGTIKQKILQAAQTNLFDPQTRTFVQARILSVVENQADRNYVQRNILNRGAIIQTDHGRAMIVSRPGQVGTINAIRIIS